MHSCAANADIRRALKDNIQRRVANDGNRHLVTARARGQDELSIPGSGVGRKERSTVRHTRVSLTDKGFIDSIIRSAENSWREKYGLDDYEAGN